MKTDRLFTLLATALLAVACGGRGQQTEGEPVPEDEVVADEGNTASKKPKDASPAADTVRTSTSLGNLPEEPFFDIVTTMGTIRVKLYKDTPKHRNNFIMLARRHFYDDVLFHRVIEDFVIQGGDPYTRDSTRLEEWGEGGPGYEIDAEFGHTHKRGSLAAARRGDFANPLKESSGSQFYLVQNAENCKELDGKYTVFGETVAGLNVIDRIARVKTDRYDRPLHPVMIRTVRPNAEMNRRALEEERRLLDEEWDFDAKESETKPVQKTQIHVADSSDLKQWEGRPLKKRENK